jgi:hypothetical protein
MIRSRRAVERDSPKYLGGRCSGYSKDWVGGKVTGRVRERGASSAQSCQQESRPETRLDVGILKTIMGLS